MASLVVRPPRKGNRALKRGLFTQNVRFPKGYGAEVNRTGAGLHLVFQKRKFR